jgi:uncharacterized protein (DUF849 family)
MGDASPRFVPMQLSRALGAAHFLIGGHVWIGFEINLLLPDGRIARDNAELSGQILY